MLALLTAAALSGNPVIDAHLQDILRDPDSAKVEQVQDPRPYDWRRKCITPGTGCERVTFTGTAHCYRVNAKNQYGGFTGWRYWWFMERDGEIVKSGDYRNGVWRYCGIETGPSQD